MHLTQKPVSGSLLIVRGCHEDDRRSNEIQHRGQVPRLFGADALASRRGLSRMRLYPSVADTRETKSKNRRSRVYQCLERACDHQFSATAGTIFHDSHLPLQLVHGDCPDLRSQKEPVGYADAAPPRIGAIVQRGVSVTGFAQR